MSVTTANCTYDRYTNSESADMTTVAHVQLHSKQFPCQGTTIGFKSGWDLVSRCWFASDVANPHGCTVAACEALGGAQGLSLPHS